MEWGIDFGFFLDECACPSPGNCNLNGGIVGWNRCSRNRAIALFVRGPTWPLTHSESRREVFAIFRRFGKSPMIGCDHFHLRELPTKQRSQVFWRKTRTFRIELSDGSVNSKSPNFATETKVPGRNTLKTLSIEAHLPKAYGRLKTSLPPAPPCIDSVRKCQCRSHLRHDQRHRFAGLSQPTTPATCHMIL